MKHNVITFGADMVVKWPTTPIIDHSTFYGSQKKGREKERKEAIKKKSIYTGCQKKHWLMHMHQIEIQQIFALNLLSVWYKMAFSAKLKLIQRSWQSNNLFNG